MSRRETFSIYLKPNEKAKLAILAQGAGESASAYIVRKVNEIWAEAFGGMHPADAVGFVADADRRRVRVNGGGMRKA